MTVIHSPLHCRQNEVREMVLENEVNHHSAPVGGQIYFNTELGKICFYSGEEWKFLAYGEDVPQGTNDGVVMLWQEGAWRASDLVILETSVSNEFVSGNELRGFSFKNSSNNLLLTIDPDTEGGWLTSFMKSLFKKTIVLEEDIMVLNKSGNGYLNLASRDSSGSEVLINLANIGSINNQALNFSSWNTAYGWGNHASAGYASGSHNHDSLYAAIGHTEVEADSSILGHVKIGTGFIVDETGCLNVDMPPPDIWYPVTGNRTSTTTFTFEGTAQYAKKIELSLVTCINSAGSVLRIGYIKSATNSENLITATVVTDTDLADGDRNFNIAVNRKVQDYLHMISIPGEQIADSANSQGVWYLDVMKDSYLLPVDAAVRTAAAGSGAACAYNVYKGSTALFSTAPDLGTNTVLRGQRPTTVAISAGDHVSLRITSSAGATNKASDFQAKLFIVPQNLFTSF